MKVLAAFPACVLFMPNSGGGRKHTATRRGHNPFFSALALTSDDNRPRATHILYIRYKGSVRDDS